MTVQHGLGRLPLDRKEPKDLRFIEKRLRGPLPGLEAQLLMAPDPRPGQQTYLEVGDGCLKAGVLLLLYRRRGRLGFILTKRTERVLHHRGQISLPGGEQLPAESLVQTALREAEEELGLSLREVKILGLLTPLYIPHSNFCIHPVVAVVPGPPEFRPREDEVAEVIEVSLAQLFDPSLTRHEIRVIEGREFNIPFYDFRGHKVWGATAMVLAEFARLLGHDVS